MLAISCISSGGKAPGPGMSDIATTVEEVDD